MYKRFAIALFIIVLAGSCALFQKPVVLVKEYDKIPETRNVNVCKYLSDSVLVYAVFVNTGNYEPWTSFDIKSTKDSLEKAMKWLETQAIENGTRLGIRCIFHAQNGKSVVNERSARAKLPTAIHTGLNVYGKGAKTISWSDAIATYAGKSVKQKSGDRLRINSVLSLNQALRNTFESENVAIVFLVNGYIQQDPSFSFNLESNRIAEHSIITTKNPATMAHEVLHLFGAVDLYPNYNYPNFNFKELQEKYPDEIMRIQHKRIEKLSLSPITKYFVGWKDTLSYADTRLLLHKYTLTEY